MAECEKCGCLIFFVDETVTHLEVDEELVKTFSGDLNNRNCVKFTYPEQYDDLLTPLKDGH